ncbi:nuclear transport factor 2 family protein [Beijerinckia sp. L45]|uniref:nuclear transport factor 2 family protein n=1 Tax=Beijerinckia sp. L45 TaxID=1641855 RepID=UPI00131D745B|nr:nuclear transport factor 2 family protein [Beijerinckia sp. L45]
MAGRPLVKRMLGLIRRRDTTISWEMDSVINTDSWLTSPWSVRGEFQNTGASYVNEGLSLIRLNRDGRIAMLSDYFKDTVAFSATAPFARAVAKDSSALVA